MPPLDARRALRLVGVAFLVYLALLLVWRYATYGYARFLAVPASALMHVIDGDVDLAAEGPRIRYVRLYDEARTAARDDVRANPVLFSWMKDLLGPVHRAMYPHRFPDGAAARPASVVQLVDTFRITLELPLFLALVLALPGVPWRRRWKPALFGVSILVPLHVFLVLTPGLWLAAGVGHLRPAAMGVEHAGSAFWIQLGERYQYIGPVLALALFLTLLLAGSFEEKRAEGKRREPPSPAPSPETPSEGA